MSSHIKLLDTVALLEDVQVEEEFRAGKKLSFDAMKKEVLG